MEEKCWICGELADSKEHKFKASDIKKAFGKKFEAYYTNGESFQKFESYKDNIIQFPKIICIACNNVRTRNHDDAYDHFVKYCFQNHPKILKNQILDFEDIFGDEWLEKKIDLYRYFAKHAGCKVKTSNFEFDLTNIANFIKGRDVCEDFVLKFELKQAVEILIKLLNRENKYTHLYNGATVHYGAEDSLTFGGWLTNNYLTTNWVIGKNISDADYLRMYEEKERVLLTDCKFSMDTENKEESEFTKMGFINEVHIAAENGYNISLNDRINFFEWLIESQ
ncbi:hypothetical protein HZR02_10175 [Elizabethkingia anophelis]|jgi:hypothetical protein|uniref:Uncharacterized protein n=1 Tax=Epilithonimonas vandammei TaxID=2487072 RepID=A0A3G8YBZ3_9FLAO|nr:hypothetical protein [Epilithonimonas vandammei]MCT3651989.1 hypothetical protein [Elizabethkingia anophelis]AZI39974.1 hypothetical protein EIB74_08355 [Epilithonimonas vandammei]MCT3659257.1 hypothetical protein [Elizabethkingia anophelis]MCT3666422.1 hypothetical protein [Elizabethkingia anophelis]MCT3852341.1 hypothetical protein [Elizabethkingia anophelis]